MIDWSKAPEWANWHAFDIHGLGYWYPSKPKMSPTCMVNTHKTIGAKRSGYENNLVHWTDSLVERPRCENSNFGIASTLSERGSRYGKFSRQAKISQALKNTMRLSDNWSKLSPHQIEALDMIQHKIARILNGDPNYDDSWRDIAGYATLIERNLNGEDI